MLTASGMGSLSMILQLFATKMKHPTLFATENPVDILQGTPFRLLTDKEPWESNYPRRAAINAFGFGGNNAHLILEEFNPALGFNPSNYSRSLFIEEPIVITSLASIIGVNNLHELINQFYFSDTPLSEKQRRIDKINFNISELNLPPKNLEKSLGQQLIVLKLVDQLLENILFPDNYTISVMIGMQCSPEMCQHGLRWRLPTLFTDTPPKVKEWLEQAQKTLLHPLESADGLGCMGNILTNQINRKFDFKGPSFSISSEQVSGIDALEVGMLQLKRHEVDAVIIGAVDLCVELTQQHSIAAMGFSKNVSDAVAMMILMRQTEAQSLGATQVARLDITQKEDDSSKATDFYKLFNYHDQFGYSHATHGLLQIMWGAICCSQKTLPGKNKLRPKPWAPRVKEGRSIIFNPDSFITFSKGVKVSECSGSTLTYLDRDEITLYVFSGETKIELKNNISDLKQSADMPHRLVVLVRDENELREKLEQIVSSLTKLGDNFADNNLYYSENNFEGSVAFIYECNSELYPQISYDLAITYPQLITNLSLIIPNLQLTLDSLYDYHDPFYLSHSQNEAALHFIRGLQLQFFKYLFNFEALVIADSSENIHQAYRDGVRTFVKIGPGTILNESYKPFIESGSRFFACDDRSNSSLNQIFSVAAQLIVGGIIVPKLPLILNQGEL
ncbi:MAG: hypothetical protein H0U71_00280 [Gammaproteobacteria bacterium]|nr:hypothetical protein [Gammaproteobacteria bacterium]